MARWSFVLALLTVFVTCRCTSSAPRTTRDSLRRRVETTVGERIAEILFTYQTWDAFFRDGIGRSDAATSGGLGWGESSFLRNYMMAYDVSRDPYWLDKVVDHFDRMWANCKDVDGDGFREWRDKAYSKANVIARVLGNAKIRIAPDSQRIDFQRGGDKVTGHTYLLEFDAPDRLHVKDQTSGKFIAQMSYHGNATVESIPGVKLSVSGKAKPGDRIKVVTVACEAIEYQVHDGMILYPLTLWVEAVLNDPNLPARYKKKAHEYLQILHQHFLRKWEPTWVDVPDGSGAYAFTKDPTQRFPGYLLPHNQYLALARAWLVLGTLKKMPDAALCRERAEKMARYFHKHLRRNGDAYVWNYWDPLPGDKINVSVEDSSHATIDVSFAIEAARRHVVFTRKDLQRFANTYVDVMWNKDRNNPLFSGRVDGSGKPKRFHWEWIQLGATDGRIWDLAWALFEAQNEPPSMAPEICYLAAQIAGVSKEERRQCRENSMLLQKNRKTEGLWNGGFELGGKNTKTPFAWELTRWCDPVGAKAEWVNDAHSGKKAVALTGVGESRNILAITLHPLKRQGDRLTIRAFYKTSGNARPFFSVISTNAAGKRIQYENSPIWPLSQMWRPAKWTVGIPKNATEVRIAVRNGGEGTTWYDDVNATFSSKTSKQSL